MWVGVAAVVVIVGAGVWYFAGSGSATPSTTGDQSATNTDSSDASSQTVSGPGTTSGSGSIGSLLALDQNLQCNVTLSTDGAQTEGMIYLSAGGKMHGDFSTTQDNNTINATTINDGTYVYSWSNLSTQGYKDTVAASATTGASTHGGIDDSTAVNYSCKVWSLDSSKFVPPSNITF